MCPVVKEEDEKSKEREKDIIKTQELQKDFGWINLDIYKIIQKNCKKYNLDVILVCSVIQNESGTYCNNNLEYMLRVRSYAGAIGLCQIMPFHVKDPRTLKDPNINIERGCWYLTKCITKARNLGFKKIYAEACRLYNSGVNAKRWEYKNWAYVNRIQNMYNRVSFELENNKIYLAAL